MRVGVGRGKHSQPSRAKGQTRQFGQDNYVFIVKSNTFQDEKGRVHTMYRVMGRHQAGNSEAGELGIGPSGS